MEVEFYSVISYALSITLGVVPWQGISDFLKNIFPIIGKNYWFISSYLVMYFLSPFLNHFIRETNYKKHWACIIVMLCCFSLPQTLPHIHWMSTEGYIEIFIILYLIGALIKKYDLFSKKKPGMAIVMIMMLLALVCSEIVIKAIKPEHFTFFVEPMSKITVIVVSVLLFGMAKSMMIQKRGIILRCAQSTFGVYLIHIGRLEKLFFERMLDISFVYRKPYFAIVLLLFSFAIFILCVFIDQIRIHIIEKPLKPVIVRISGHFEEKIHEIEIMPESRITNKTPIE